jgi:hypothetical protein
MGLLLRSLLVSSEKNSLIYTSIFCATFPTLKLNHPAGYSTTLTDIFILFSFFRLDASPSVVLGRVIKEDLLSCLDVSDGVQTESGQSRFQAIYIDSVHSQIGITRVIYEVGYVAV